jgi:hypothetical protein
VSPEEEQRVRKLEELVMEMRMTLLNLYGATIHLWQPSTTDVESNKKIIDDLTTISASLNRIADLFQREA